ncbi:MAG: hypothetical protein WC718_07550, partial [Phycisphaerales bacterium]
MNHGVWRNLSATILVLAAGSAPVFGQGVMIAPGMRITIQSGNTSDVQGEAAAPMDEPPPMPEPDASGEAPTDGVAAAAPTPPAKVSKEETEALKSEYESLPKDGQDEMKAYYKDLGVDLDQLLGLATAANEAMMRFQEAANTMRELDFTRSPTNVLNARAKLGFGQVPRPNVATARGADLTKWIHLLVMAGEWQQYGAFLKELPPKDAATMYASVLQMLNRGPAAGLLPEEVLAVAEACPEDEPKVWEVKAWTAMVQAAAGKNSPGTMLASIKQGTRFFGADSPEKSRRTVELLAGAGLVQEAYAYLPPLDEARTAADGELVLVHGKYQADLATRAGEAPEADGYRASAWQLYCEVTQMDRASTDARSEAVRLAIGMMSKMPRSQVNPWLQQVFADDTLAPAALQGIAVSAASVNEGQGLSDE